jgi:hypothetical protein
MKEIFNKPLRALLLSICVFCFFPAFALEVEIAGINYELDTDAKTATVIANRKVAKYSGKVIVPETVVHNNITYSVTAIGDYAFEKSHALSSVSLPNNLRSVGPGAFKGCTALTNITIPNNVKLIGHNAFTGCVALTSVKIGKDLESIGAEAFSACDNLRDFRCYSTKVPSTEENVFDVHEKATLHVKKKMVKKFKNADSWRAFAKIMVINP